jgi:hypothetical protein
MYIVTITATSPRKRGGSGVKPRRGAKGRNGTTGVTATTPRGQKRDVGRNYFSGDRPR